jgi:glucose-6-phosphate 1-dehydrogenase
VLDAPSPVLPYERGGWGPKEADVLIAENGGWHNLGAGAGLI